MSDLNPLTVPAAGWYPDRSDPAVKRWWDGGQWTDHVIAPEPALVTSQGVSASAFGFDSVTPAAEPAQLAQPVQAAQPVQLAQAAQPAQAAQSAQVVATVAAPADTGIAPGWYPDNSDPRALRWWDGRGWTSHLQAAVAAMPTTPAPGSYLGAGAAPMAPQVASNGLATAAMVVSLIGIPLSSFLIPSIVGLILGIVARRRATRSAPGGGRRGFATTAIVAGAAGIVIFIGLVAAAIPVYLSVHSGYDRLAVQKAILSELQAGGGDTSRVECPQHPTVAVGATFTCTAFIADGKTMRVIGTFTSNLGTYTWRTAPAESSADGAGGTDGGAAFALPTTREQMEQGLLTGFTGHGMDITSVSCPTPSFVAGTSTSCVATFSDGVTMPVRFDMGTDQDDTGYDFDVPPGEDPGDTGATSGSGSDADQADA